MKKFFVAFTIFFISALLITTAQAQEVGKGKIPENQLAASYKKLDWGVSVWDVEEAVTQLKSKDKVLWVDTRPESFFKKGTVKGAILLPYNKTGADGNVMTAETLDKAVTDAGLDKATTKVIMFCQGPKCHRSYNATFKAVGEWGYKVENVVWFRAGYPLLFSEVKGNQKLKRKAKRYISEEGVKQL